MHLLTYYRMLHLAGRFGGGKTSLGLWLALQLVHDSRARYIASNIPLSFDAIGQYQFLQLADFRDTVIFLDEAHQKLAAGMYENARHFLAFLRHRNQFLIMPSVFKLTGQASIFRCERSFNGTALGLPVWYYNWWLDTGLGKGTQGRYAFWFPGRVFPFYDHTHDPDENEDNFYLYDFGGDNGESEEAQQDAWEEVGDNQEVGVGVKAYDWPYWAIDRDCRYCSLYPAESGRVQSSGGAGGAGG